MLWTFYCVLCRHCGCCSSRLCSCSKLFILLLSIYYYISSKIMDGFFDEQLGGPTWEVPLGRRDSTTASRTTANNDIPPPFLDLPALIKNFKKQGLDEKDLVALSSGHTLGFAQCSTFRNRIYNDTNIDSTFASQRKANCPRSGEPCSTRSNSSSF